MNSRAGGACRADTDADGPGDGSLLLGGETAAGARSRREGVDCCCGAGTEEWNGDTSGRPCGGVTEADGSFRAFRGERDA